MVKVKEKSTSKAKKQQEDYAAELQQSFERWDYLNVYGGSDPTWSDGCNMNLVRNHIIIGKRRIEETMPPEQYPAVYHRETPAEADRDYMARVDEIRANAKISLERYNADSDYQFLLCRVLRMTEWQMKETCIKAVLGYVSGLENAIEKDDLITMRRHERASGYIDSFSACAERVRNLKPIENEQLNLFADYSDYEEEEQDEDEWDYEM